MSAIILQLRRIAQKDISFLTAATTAPSPTTTRPITSYPCCHLWRIYIYIYILAKITKTTSVSLFLSSFICCNP